MHGETIDGRYIIRGLQAASPIGERYDAEDTQTGQSVSLQIGLPAGKPHRAALEKRVAALRRLLTPGLAGTIGGGWHGDAPYLVLANPEGHRMHAGQIGRPVDIHSALLLTKELLNLLATMHSQGVVHGDVRPSNMLLKPTMGVPDLMLTGYAFSGEGGEEADVRAAAAVLYDLLTGEAPVTGKRGHHASLRNPSVPPALDDLLAGLLAGGGSLDRDAKAVRERLMEIGEDLPSMGSEPGDAPPSPSGPPG